MGPVVDVKFTDHQPAIYNALRVKRPATQAVAAGTAKLVGTNTGAILTEAAKLLDDPAAHAAMAKAVNPFGDGHAAERIVSILLRQ